MQLHDSAEAFGQHEALTTRLKHILDAYADGPGIISELVQNADDAGATEVRLMLDSNPRGTKSLLGPRLAEVQGPALVAWNDAVFSPSDFHNIARIGQDSKIDKPAAAGRFELGFNAVYHFTDVPSFVSGEYLVMFDPHATHLPGATPARPGLKIAFADSPLLSQFPDQFAGYLGTFGCDLTARTRRRCFGSRFDRKTPRRRPRSNPRRTPRTTCVDSSNNFDRAPRRRSSFSKRPENFRLRTRRVKRAEKQKRATVRASLVFCTRRPSPRSRTGTTRARLCFDGWRARRAAAPAGSGARFSKNCAMSPRRPSRPPWAGWTSPSGPKRPKKTRKKKKTKRGNPRPRSRPGLPTRWRRPRRSRVSASRANGGWCAVRWPAARRARSRSRTWARGAVSSRGSASPRASRTPPTRRAVPTPRSRLRLRLRLRPQTRRTAERFVFCPSPRERVSPCTSTRISN